MEKKLHECCKTCSVSKKRCQMIPKVNSVTETVVYGIKLGGWFFAYGMKLVGRPKNVIYGIKYYMSIWA